MFFLVATSPLAPSARSEEELPQMLASLKYSSRIEGEELFLYSAVCPLLGKCLAFFLP
jgi:hypothetical protein